MVEIGKDIGKATALLEAGHVVAIPTETVYGLAADALNADAVAKIFAIKNRPHFDPIIIHVHSIYSALLWIKSLPRKAEDLANEFWPGPLTMLFEKKPAIPDLVTAGLNTVGIRCPDHELTRELLANIHVPLAAPSANPFGYASPTRPQHVKEQLGSKIQYILDGGPCKVGIESTIIGFEGDETVIYRLGGLSVERIEKFVGKVRLRTHSTSRPLAPGQLTRHYSTTKKLMLGDIAEMLKVVDRSKAGILSFNKTFNEVESTRQFILSPASDLEEAAKNLFVALRELDKLPIDVILAEPVPDVGLGRAINDRLRRAAAE